MDNKIQTSAKPGTVRLRGTDIINLTDEGPTISTVKIFSLKTMTLLGMWCLPVIPALGGRGRKIMNSQLTWAT
jgi:hypothetical protein